MSRFHSSTFRWTWIALIVAGLTMAGQVQATIVTVSSDNVNRLIGPTPGPAFPNTVFTDVFSTHGFGPQKSLVFLSNASLLTALQTTLGPDNGRGYRINSATLTIGSVGDNYSPSTGPVTGHLLLQSYVPAEVTYNSRATGTLWAASGMLAGTDYASASVTTGTATPGFSGFKTDFNGLGTVVQGWFSNTTPNRGLLFQDASFTAANISDFTDAANLVWTLDASIVPEPSTILLLGIGGLLVFRRRWCQSGNH